MDVEDVGGLLGVVVIVAMLGYVLVGACQSSAADRECRAKGFPEARVNCAVFEVTLRGYLLPAMTCKRRWWR
jgi:hypothetical protein